jgi:transposase
MNLHANAALGLKGRRELCRQVVVRKRTLAQAAEAAGVSVRCARKWVGRYRTEGEPGLRDRSSAPHRIPHRTSQQRVDAIVALRRLRFTGPEIAECLGMASSTVSAVLKRAELGKLSRVGVEPAVRYERERPGELIHVDIKKPGRIERHAGARIVGMANRVTRPLTRDAAGVKRQTTGWEYVHVAVDDCTRLAYAEVLPNQKGITVASFLGRACAFYARHGITVRDRQRPRLHLRRARRRVPRAQCPSPPDPPLPAADQRQSRAVHPHPHRRLGVRRHLPQQHRTDQRT